MIHEDIIPFLILSAASLAAGIAGKEKNKKIVMILFFAAGIIPLLAYISNSEKFPIPVEIEMIGFLAPLALLPLGAFCARKQKKNGKRVFLWASTSIAICTSLFIGVTVVGNLFIPV